MWQCNVSTIIQQIVKHVQTQVLTMNSKFSSIIRYECAKYRYIIASAGNYQLLAGMSTAADLGNPLPNLHHLPSARTFKLIR